MILRLAAAAVLVAIIAGALAACTELVELHRPTFTPDARVIDGGFATDAFPIDAPDVTTDAPASLDAAITDAGSLDAAP